MGAPCFPPGMERFVARNFASFVASLILLLLAIQRVESQQERFSNEFRNVFVEPFGSTTLQCHAKLPDDLPKGIQPFFQWRFMKTGHLGWSTVASMGYISSATNLKTVGDLTKGQFDLFIANVTYEVYDGVYCCEVSIPEYEGKPTTIFKSPEFHVYATYQPQPPETNFSTSLTELREGERLVISCTSRDGNPPPQISWMRNGVQVASAYTAARNRHDISKADLVIDKLSKDDHRAVYTCVVKNDAISQAIEKSLAPLDVKYKPRITVGGYITGLGVPKKDSSGVLSVEAGQEVMLTCSVDANPPVSAPSWRRDKQLFQENSYNYTFPTGRLTRESAGTYFCVASNGIDREQVGEVKLDVLYEPIVAVTPDPLTITEGSSGALRCNVDSNPKADTVEWFDQNGKQVASTEVLSLTDVKKSQAGFYTCRARTSFLPATGGPKVMREGSGTGKLIVNYRPGVANIEAVTTNVFVGGPVSLRCTTSDLGEPPATFRWRKIDRTTVQSAGSHFNISDAKLDDIGEYECTAYNTVGDGVPAMYKLEVSERVSWTPDSYFERDIIRKITDGPLSLACSARGRPAPQFVWLKDGVEIKKNDRLYKVNTNEPSQTDRHSFITRSELRFEGPSRTELFSSNNSLQRTDRGRYTCKALNGPSQPIERTTNILIQYPPVFRNRFNKVATDISRSATSPLVTRVECLVESRPPPQVAWTRNGQPVSTTGRVHVEDLQVIDEENFKSVLVIDSTTGDDLGDYRCSATNLIGDNTLNLSVVRRSVPDEPRNLKQKDLAYNAVTLTWDTGFDGGHEQKVFIVVRNPDNTIREIPVAADASEFRVTALQQSSNYNFRLRSENQLGRSRDSGENIDVRTPVKPILPEDIPRPASLKFNTETGIAVFAVPTVEKFKMCAVVAIRRGNDNWTPVERCLPLPNKEAMYRIPEKLSPDMHVQVQFCLVDNPEVCGIAEDDQSILLQSSIAEPRLDIILPIVIVLGVLFCVCLAMFCFCRKRMHKTPVKAVKASTSTIATTGSNGNGGIYGDGYLNKGIQENGLHGTLQNGKGFYGIESQYGNGSLYAHVEAKKLAGDYMDNGLAYKAQLSDPNAGLYSSTGLYMQSYPSYDEGYGHQHSPTDPSFTHMPPEIGLPDPYEEYEKTPSFGEDSVESGYSTSNSRGRRVIREIIV